MTKELTAEDYLDKEFPKGETKFRGQAMVLLALAKMQGRTDALKKVEKEIDDILDKIKNNWNKTNNPKLQVIRELNQLIQRLEKLRGGEK